MYRRMIVIFYIKINRQVIKGIFLIHRNIILKLPVRDPDRFLIDICFIRQQLAVSPVPKHICYCIFQILQNLSRTVPLDLLVHEFGQTPFRLGRYDPGIIPGICQFKAQKFVHVIAFLPADSRTHQYQAQYNCQQFRQDFFPFIPFFLSNHRIFPSPLLFIIHYPIEINAVIAVLCLKGLRPHQFQTGILTVIDIGC